MRFRSGLLIIMIFLGAFRLPVLSQNPGKKTVITGKVTDPAKNPLSGVTILIDNKNAGCETNRKGLYRIKVSSGAKSLTAFSMMNGMKQLPIDGKTVIDFELFPASAEPVISRKKEKEETVEAGYGTMKKKEVTTNVSKIDGQNPKFASYSNIYDMISSEVPGVRVNGKSIYIVELTSINSSNEPLLIVDGRIVFNFDDIVPSMVKSIEVLKGASASIYGSRGSNGVILITLLKGPGQK